jgi:hypothetical protein
MPRPIPNAGLTYAAAYAGDVGGAGAVTNAQGTDEFNDLRRQLGNQNGADVGKFLNPLQQLFDCIIGTCDLVDWGLAATSVIPALRSAGMATKGLSVAGKAAPRAARQGFLRDYATKSTKNWSAKFKGEREARNLARQKLGSKPTEIEPGKWRSADGKWQYRAKPEDLLDNHIHLEELNPKTGEVLQNLHLRW